MNAVDLHVHSCYSDGTMHIDEIIDDAIRKNTTLIAVADHNQLEGSRELLEKVKGKPLKAIAAVEIDAIHQGMDIHILAYGVDLYNASFVSFVVENRKKLDQMSVELIEAMSVLPEGINLSLADYEAFSYDVHLGGWKALHYFVAKGITKTIYEGMPLYEKYNCHYDKAGFLSVEEVCDKVHDAGGYAILAHPGVTFKNDLTDMDKFKKICDTMLQSGVDGIECFYPKHTEALTSWLVNYCNHHVLYKTSGSDCHGLFGNASIGDPETKLDAINIRG